MIAASSDWAFKSGIFSFAISSTCLAVTVPTFVLFGSAEPNKNKVGTVTAKQVEEIAKLKMPDLNCDTLESAVKTVAGTARSMGLDVVG